MYDNAHVWVIRAASAAVSLSAPKTVIQYAASATVAAHILGFSVSQASTVTSAQEIVRLGRVTAGSGFTAGLVGTNIFRWGSADDNFKGQVGAALTGTGVGVTPTEPTYTDVPKEVAFNVLNGYEVRFVEPLYVPASGFVGLRVAGTIAATWQVELFVRELAG